MECAKSKKQRLNSIKYMNTLSNFFVQRVTNLQSPIFISPGSALNSRESISNVGTIDNVGNYGNISSMEKRDSERECECMCSRQS